MFSKLAPILIVDDMIGARGLIKKQLESMGYQTVLEAANGELALQELQKALSADPVQLIISDWNMPVMNGLDLLTKVRAEPRYSNTPFLMVTAEGDARQIVRAFELKVSDYITKPFTSERLFKTLGSIWSKHNPKN